MIPVGDSPRSRTFPFVNWAIILINAAVFIYMLGLSDTVSPNLAAARAEFQRQTAAECYGLEAPPTPLNSFLCRYGIQPKELLDVAGHKPAAAGVSTAAVVFALFTAMFIHGGWLHILGNMLFLWVFGDNIEDRFGHLRYLLFYLAGGIAASFVQVFLEPNSLVPVIGASGAVAAVLGAYIVLYARATVQVIIPVFIFFPLALPAWVMIGLWFGQNLLAGYFTITSATSADAGVAWFAHIGGFIFGMAVAFVAFTQRGSANRPLPPPDWD